MNTYEITLATPFDPQAVILSITTTDKETARRVIDGLITGDDRTYRINNIQE